MGTEFSHAPEPFPLFIDSAPPNSANYFSSPIAMAAVQLLAASASPSEHSLKSITIRRPRIAMPAKVSNYLWLRYYQYEVTFGLYMLTSGEKMLFNSVILGTSVAILFAIVYGFEAFIFNALCRLVYYITGSFDGAPGLCS